MLIEDRVVERKLLLKRVFPRTKLFKIGKSLSIDYFNRFISKWDIDEDDAALEIALNIGDAQLEEILGKYEPRAWTVFRGRNYTFEDGKLTLGGSWERLQANIHQAKKKFGEACVSVLKTLVQAAGSCGIKEIKEKLKQDIDPLPILAELERLKIIVTSYRGDRYQEWKILEEVSPLVQSELGMSPPTPLKVTLPTAPPEKAQKVDYVSVERQRVQRMDKELEDYLSALIAHRLDETLEFGKTFSVAYLVNYLQNQFGPILFFDSLLSIIQQCGIADTEIVHERGKTGMRTGWSLALFGEPGTGKSFSTRDMILGKIDAKVPPHGVPGRNRYCGGITPARFIRIGQAYSERTFNFIVPEFNDWFKYSGMVESLKLAMERGELRYETHMEVVGPYQFRSFFSVNYNVETLDRGYAATVQDPNFNAIEDRMLCRLHRLTKERFVEIAESQMRLAFGEIDIEKGAQKIRDHLTLVYAIETEHPLVKGRFPKKPVMITSRSYDLIKRAREAILEQIPQEFVRFSARLEDRAIRFACAASLLNYFQSNLEYIPVSDDALKYAVQLYVEEASVRSRGEFEPEEVLKRIA